jgi:hypothetical protein
MVETPARRVVADDGSETEDAAALPQPEPDANAEEQRHS